MPAALGLTFTFADRKGKNSTTIINIPSNTAMPDAIIFGQQMALLIDPLITGTIQRVGVALTVDISGLGLNTVAADAADVEEGGFFQFLTNGGFRTSNRIPTFDEAKVTVGGTDINQVDTDVAAFLTAMESGLDLVPSGGSGVVSPTDGRDDDITSTEVAREAFQSSR